LARAVRFGTAGNAWERLGTDKFFSRRKKMRPKSQVQSGGGECLQSSEKRRRAAALQNAGAIYSVPPGSTSAFAPKLRRDKQVVDISSKMAKSRVASRLIFRGLRGKQAFFDPFIALNGLIFRLL
jgi:hypothetical protein